MSKTDSTLVIGYSPKVQKACFLNQIDHFVYGVEQNKKRHLLQQMIVALQMDCKEQQTEKD